MCVVNGIFFSFRFNVARFYFRMVCCCEFSIRKSLDDIVTHDV